jgi:ferredoxin
MAVTDVQHALYHAPAGWLETAAKALLEADTEVYAPTESQDGAADLTRLTDADGIALDYLNVRLPLKRLLFPATESLLEYDIAADGDIEMDAAAPPSREAVVFGARPCDAAALEALDAVFNWDYQDTRYDQHRERTTIVAFACTAPDEHCFCTSLGGSPHGEAGSDVLAFLRDDGSALIKVLTEKGQALAERLDAVLEPAPEDAEPPSPPEVEEKVDPDQVNAWLDANFESDLWTDVALRCVGCGTCSYLCPTCHCFDIVDEAAWNRGERRRNWDCCSFGIFTRHASGHNPRPDQAARYRQRVMHKFKYFPERFGRLACVGCGRCIRHCGVGQNLLLILTDIEAQNAGDESGGH